MRQIKDVLRLELGLQHSRQHIASTLGISKRVVTKYVNLTSQAGLHWPQIQATRRLTGSNLPECANHADVQDPRTCAGGLSLNWRSTMLDSKKYSELVTWLKGEGAHREQHSGSNLLAHLEKTYAILAAAGIEDDVCLAGLFHSLRDQLV